MTLGSSGAGERGVLPSFRARTRSGALARSEARAWGSYRWVIVSRTLAAILGGYLLSSLMIIVVGAIAPRFSVNRAQAVHAATMASFVLYAVVIMAVFHTRTATRAWLSLLAVALPLAALALVFAGN